jgi:hypothetical protein
MSDEPAKSKRYLNQGQNAELYLWMKENKDRIEKDRLSQKDVAEQSSKALKFDITEGNVRGHAEHMGIKWARSGSGSVANFLKVAEDRIASLEASVKALEDHVLKLYATLGNLEPEVGRLRIAVNALAQHAEIPAAAGVPVNAAKNTTVANRR